MNLQVYKSLRQGILPFLLLALIIGAGCKKEDVILYEVNPVDVRKPGASKDRVKTTTEFISIAYSDIFGTTISQARLAELTTCYISCSDKKLIEDMIIKNFLNSPGTSVPPASELTSDPEKFISDAYKKFFNREPGEYELWWMKDFIADNPSSTPVEIYYAFLTSDEYRYY